MERNITGGGKGMSTLETNMALLSTIPEEYQREMQSCLLVNYWRDNPYKLLSEHEILTEQQI